MAKTWCTLYSKRPIPSQIIFCSRCHTKRRIGGAPRAHPSFGMTTTKISSSVFPYYTDQDETNMEQNSQMEQNVHLRQNVPFQQIEVPFQTFFQQSASNQNLSAPNQSASALLFNTATQYRSALDQDISAPVHNLDAPHLSAPSQTLSAPRQGFVAPAPSAARHSPSASSGISTSNQILIPSSSSQSKHILTPRSSLYENVSLVRRPPPQPPTQKSRLRNILTHFNTNGKL